MRTIIILSIFILMLIAFCCFLESGWPEELTVEDLIPKIIKVESNGDPHAVGKVGEIGLMQISPIVLREYSNWIEFDYDPDCLYVRRFNVVVGTWYLNRLKDRYIPKDKYSVEVLLASYNWGIGNMKKVDWDWTKAPKQVKNYIKKVLN